ncbi:MAG: xanthine dehydrogenase [Candidatus Schekmanbacteria bacterium GWA2_38_9]|uniref:Xanthine dehydrogenase n=1 Tax=Candidatus Schekmanbacteria bacterium RIFCSPLOWO2_12_FULL_38_15 TaxID=1817883 RepID=A0A1F7SFV2_9BACT|nr:MAG: xanthine dehydrogenase [Candidatus Schekmanbacteria bacterium GWA2_38_9]OGL49128.1 MAG: xanthine dehydrogenase [Candidatus Schekmanbacteria bacterium RIFCSPLOWO2_02_FULL_38_14]OGL52104.1 MAG: xanthine dehydrogenase [Candidatus Schekmanbacteria bacterium RIFCSPLOWO2_12_FULL_38_15]
MLDIYKEIVRIRESGEKAALATIVSRKGSTPRKESAKMLIKSDGSIIGSIGGGCVEGQVWDDAKEVIKKGKSKILHFDLTNEEIALDGLACGGKMDVLIEPILPVPTMFIFGAGHISLPLCKIAKIAGFRVVIIDDRDIFANRERFPDADEIIVESFETVFNKLRMNDSSYLVIVTRGHLYDEKVLELSLRTKTKYVGMIGSKRKIKTIFTNLKSRGATQAQLEKIYTPIGLPIDAETPEEIAVSIMAEVIKVKQDE